MTSLFLTATPTTTRTTTPTATPTTTPTTTGGGARNGGGRLAAEWARLRIRPDMLRQADGWGLIEGSLHDLDQVLTVVGYDRDTDELAEMAMRRLVELAATSDLAARVVIQRLVPGLLSVVRRRRRDGCAGGGDLFEELLGALWISIRTYNTDRQPSSVAAALIADADYRAFRVSWRRKSNGERPTDLSDEPIASHERTSSCDELAELLALARQSGFDADDLLLLRNLLEQPTANDAARVLKITPRTLRNRRDRITLQLRELALAA